MLKAHARRHCFKGGFINTASIPLLFRTIRMLLTCLAVMKLSQIVSAMYDISGKRQSKFFLIRSRHDSFSMGFFLNIAYVNLMKANWLTRKQYGNFNSSFNLILKSECLANFLHSSKSSGDKAKSRYPTESGQSNSILSWPQLFLDLISSSFQLAVRQSKQEDKSSKAPAE